jgi:DNA-binding NtrC family response regulator
VEVEVPALRDRRSDILVMAHAFLRKFAQSHGRTTTRFSAVAMAALQEHAWPGNVRELQNVIERAVVLCDGAEIGIGNLPQELSDAVIGTSVCSFDQEVREFKGRLIQRALTQTGYNKVQAAQLLGIARSSLHRLIDELQIQGTTPGPADRSADRMAHFAAPSQS